MSAKGNENHPSIRLVRLGDGTWRACDPTLDEPDPQCVLAFIERQEDRFHVVWVRESTANRVVETLEAALDSVFDRLIGAQSHSTSPIPIPHAAPLVPRTPSLGGNSRAG